MPEKPLTELEEMVGESRTAVRSFEVEPIKIAEFADAVRDEDPIYRDESVAAERGYDAIPAPPPFAWGSIHERYRTPENEWPGFQVGFDLSRSLHGEQGYAFERPLLAGDRLTGTITFEDVYQREGARGGRMTFAEFETEYRDEDGTLVVTESSTLIELADERDPGDGDPGGDRPPEADHTLVVTDLSRVDFVRWAGAVGDYARLHIDEPYARDAGYPSVFAPGMLVAGFASRLVTDWIDHAALASFDARFTGIVYPGDTLTVTGDERDASDGPELEVTVHTDSGEDVLAATATARSDAEP